MEETEREDMQMVGEAQPNGNAAWDGCCQLGGGWVAKESVQVAKESGTSTVSLGV